MKEFITQHIDLALAILAVLVFIVMAVRMIRKAKKIDTEGIIVKAVVTRIHEDWDPETAGSSYTTYVQYEDEQGTIRESAMSLTPTIEHNAGEQVMIRFLPGDYKMVREVKD